MKSFRLRVIKLGGSLLDWKDLKSSFQEWMNRQQPAARNLLVVGGGEVVESFRKLDQLHGFDPHFAHWLAVDLMTINARIAARILDLNDLISTPAALQAFLSGQPTIDLPRNAENTVAENTVAVVQPPTFYSRELAERADCPLLESWECTSDSIAAYLATLFLAEELVLLKSSLPNYQTEIIANCEQLRQLSDAGLVDRALPEVASHLACVRIVNLRAQA